jgi:hypothetical protein
MEPEVADYLTSIASLIVMATYDIPGLISLGCDLNRMRNIDAFRANVFSVVVPILNKRDSDLPPRQLSVLKSSLAFSHMSRYDRPSHQVYMFFFVRSGWQVQFLEADICRS